MNMKLVTLLSLILLPCGHLWAQQDSTKVYKWSLQGGIEIPVEIFNLSSGDANLWESRSGAIGLNARLGYFVKKNSEVFVQASVQTFQSEPDGAFLVNEFLNNDTQVLKDPTLGLGNFQTDQFLLGWNQHFFVDNWDISFHGAAGLGSAWTNQTYAFTAKDIESNYMIRHRFKYQDQPTYTWATQIGASVYFTGILNSKSRWMIVADIRWNTQRFSLDAEHETIDVFDERTRDFIETTGVLRVLRIGFGGKVLF